ncbi:hypothetical protein AAHE18_03G009500 [Arachis hypogaea]
MALDRLNSPTTFEMPLEVLGHELQFTQERNCRKGRFSPAKLKGKRVIELGAGCGVSGFGMAMLGCDVIVTDQKEVLPLLQRNIERNISRVMQKNPESFGSIKVAELQWGDESHIKAVDPPFDYIIGTDVVYVEHLLEPLLQTILALSGPRTTILMDETYQHPSIQLFIMGFKNSAESTGNSGQAAAEKVDDQTGVEGKSGEENLAMEPSSSVEKNVEDHEKAATGTKKLSEWEARRYGSMAARILKDVKIS